MQVGCLWARLTRRRDSVSVTQALVFFPPEHRWIDLSPDAKHLLMSMLTYDPNRRLTARQVRRLGAELIHLFWSRPVLLLEWPAPVAAAFIELWE